MAQFNRAISSCLQPFTPSPFHRTQTSPSSSSSSASLLDPELADAFFVSLFSSLSFNSHGHSMTDLTTEIDRRLEVLQGLVYLHHERHVIHREIKLSNLLVNHKGEVKITDIGVIAMLAISMGQRDTFVGTYNYMSICNFSFSILLPKSPQTGCQLQ